MLVAEICANVTAKNVTHTYNYAVPEHLNYLTAGWRVIIPFGKQQIDGFIMNIKEIDSPESVFNFELKEIIDAVDEEAWFTPTMLKLAEWIADFYLCPLAQSMTLFMPGRVSRKITPKLERVLKLIGNVDEIKFVRTQLRLRLLDILREKKSLSVAELRELKFSREMIKPLVDAGILAWEERRVLRDSYANIRTVAKTIELTAEQSAAIESVEFALTLKMFQGFLLHGVTGSGKTQVYIEVTKIARRMGRRVVILVPEISLTGQIVRNFKEHFADVLVIHSRLSVAERSDAFHRIRNGDAGVIIGARSALFTPVDNVGLIVVDEEQDHAYKQESPPYYHARVIAEEFAKFHNAAIVFGSATPSLETYYRAQIGELIYLELPHRVFNQPLPIVECVDMRQELKSGNKSVLSRSLQSLLNETLQNHQQAILLLNRRGYSTFVMCRDCGFVVTCSDCGLPMTYHKDGKLRCHHCEIEEMPPEICPACNSKRIKYFGTGTQKLEQFLGEQLPNARILRMDRDTTAKKLGHEKIMEQFKSGEYDILFGTQMVAKGHDVDNVTAVGILSADSILNFPAFRAAEDCFMMITQAAGRAGRANLPGKVVVQAYNVEADAVVLGCKQDYKSFCEIELPKREFAFFPPYSRLVKLIFSSPDAQKARNRAEVIVNTFKFEVANVESRQEIHGPIPAMIANLRGVYRFAVLIQSSDLNVVKNFLREHNLHISDDIQIDIDPTTTD